MKTVVHILPYMAKGGTEKHVLTLMRGLRTKYNLILLAPKGEILEEFLNLGIEYKEFPEIKRNVFNKVKAFENALLELSKKYTIDILHIHAAHEFLIFSKKVLPETPIIFHLSAYQGSSISKWINYKLAALICRKKADYVVAVSDEEKRIITKKGLQNNKIRIIYNGYESKEGDDIKTINDIKKLYNLEEYTIIGNLGRLHRTKRLNILIKAFAILKNNIRQNVKLLFIGDGPEKKHLQNLSSKLGIKNDVIFTGFIKRGDKILKIFDIFILPTSFEGCSNVLVEAMAIASTSTFEQPSNEVGRIKISKIFNILSPLLIKPVNITSFLIPSLLDKFWRCFFSGPSPMKSNLTFCLILFFNIAKAFIKIFNLFVR